MLGCKRPHLECEVDDRLPSANGDTRLCREGVRPSRASVANNNAHVFLCLKESGQDFQGFLSEQPRLPENREARQRT